MGLKDKKREIYSNRVGNKKVNVIISQGTTIKC